MSKPASYSDVGRRELLRAQLALMCAQLAVWTRPEGKLVTARSSPLVEPDEDACYAARRLARAVSTVSQRGLFRPTCLVRSLALARLLERDHVPGCRLRIGVRERAGRFEAHAWVEVGAEVLADSSEHVASFERLADLRLLRTR